MKSFNKGFTLMELLIVIGVLGILAAGLLAAIDPFEQLKKARDTNNRSAAIELLQSSQRYYATHGYLPWFKTSGVGTYVCDDTTYTGFDNIRLADTADPRPYIIVNKSGSIGHEASVATCVEDTLGADGEIKDTFMDGLATSLYLTSGDSTKTRVCFAPEGKSNRTDDSTKFILDTSAATVAEDTAGTTCPDVTLSTCLQCFE